ncbi:MAG: efflux RND transporter permease subunit [Leptospirales bacterium]|nr:efflux RND transporter permease subunit [Leptospirales bacterium]
MNHSAERSQQAAGQSPGPLDRIIHFSIERRRLVAAAALVLGAFFAVWVPTLPVDVFPDLDRPVVTVLTEAQGLAAGEVETQITVPLEQAISGAPGVSSLQSASRRGLSMVSVYFDWQADLFRSRQIVAERLSTLNDRLPAGIQANLAPASSIMGEVQMIGLYPTQNDGALPLQLRDFADWRLRPRLLSLPGVSAVTVLGGDRKQYQILLDPARLAAANIDLGVAAESLSGLGLNSSGGAVHLPDREIALRVISDIYDPQEIGLATLGFRGGQRGLPVRVADIAAVRVAAAPPVGDAGINGLRGVIVAVQKHPGVSTLQLDQAIARRVAELQRELPRGARMSTQIFRQADYIERSLHNIAAAIRDASVILCIALAMFLWNGRSTLISLAAIPLSLGGAAGVLHLLGLEINTMTLGGLTIAVGELVDDAIVDVENVHRRLRENALRPTPAPALHVIFAASREVRASIVLAVMTVILVFLPALFLDGIEGQLFRPLAAAYICAVLSSLVIALTLTPALCALLLSGEGAIAPRETKLLQVLKAAQQRNLRRLFQRPLLPALMALLLFLLSAALFWQMPAEFLPDFNEGSLTIELQSAPGVSLPESVRRVEQIEASIRRVHGVVSTARRTGRAENDEHGEGLHSAELEVLLHPALSGAARQRSLARIRELASERNDVNAHIGQPISHRIDHIATGIRSPLAATV